MHHRWLVIAVSVAAAYGCGSNEEGASSGGSGGSGAAATGGAAGTGAGATGGVILDGAGGTAATGASSGSGGTGGGQCGDTACANHTGDHDFIEPGAPGDAPGVFGGATDNPPGTDATKEPAIVYPNHETMFPINVSHIHHEWKPGGTNDLFRLRFVGPNTTVSVYTTSPNWEPTEEEWDWIAESNRGASVMLSVTALQQSAPSNAYSSSSIKLLFSESEVEGAIYYWSTGSQGVMKALVSDPVPVKFYTDPAATDAATCVACHTLSRDGKRLAVGYGAEKLREVSVPARATLVPVTGQAARASSWTTFSPDGKLLLVAAAGVLTLIDADTGAPVGPNAGVVTLPAGKVGTHPDWSALGTEVVFTLGTRGGGKDVEGGSIAILPYSNGAWGSASILVQSSGVTDNNYFPAWSPDSQWIVYANAATKSKDAVTATLRLVKHSGGAPVVMTRLNERVNNQDGVITIGNAMPTWAPSTQAGTFWIAFSSLRAYGTLRPQDAKEDQIWIAAIDPTLADPGYAGFWAPFQSIDQGNHRAFWTHTEGDKQCRCQDECGDGLDNDCDGTADEADCVSCGPVEICGDGLDNNCDCVVDDCVDEICNDGIDNDGDGLIDAADPAYANPH